MAKTQRSLFENERFERDDNSGLILVSRPDRPLTPGQRLFNKLVAQVEELRRRLGKETRTLDKALAYYGKHVHPRLKRCNMLRQNLVLAMAPFLDANRLKRKRDRETLAELIGEYLDRILEDEHSLDPNLRALFERIHGTSYEALEREELDDVRSEMESMFEEFGIDIDLTELRPDMSPESIAAKMAEISANFRETMKENARSHGTPGGRKSKKSKKQLNREEQMRQAEEVRKKSIASIYKQLAKVLHPDLEQEETRRHSKVALMQELTTAYHANDLHTLLKLELEWIEREENNLERLTEEKLAIYNDVLKEQISELKQQIAELPLHPRYEPIVEMDGPFDISIRTDGRAESQWLDAVISRMESSLERMQNGNAYYEVQAAIRDYRAVSREMQRGDLW